MSLYAYINPIIAVVLGALLLGEPFDSRVIAAAVLVLAGLALVRYASAHPPDQRTDSSSSPIGPASALDVVVQPHSRTRRNRALGMAGTRTVRLQLMFAIGLLLLTASLAAGQTDPAPTNTAESSKTSQWLQFVGGAAVGFGAHESGHVFFDVVFDASPGVKRIEFGGIPFFAVTHDAVSVPRGVHDFIGGLLGTGRDQ